MIFCKVKIEFTFILEERFVPIRQSRTVQSHEAKIYENNIDSLRSKVGGSCAQIRQSETSQLELSLKSHGFQKFSDPGAPHTQTKYSFDFYNF